jgi:probable HAF family extracellular repeat protein
MGLPNTGNPLTSDPYIQHAFRSKDGALIDLGVLPGGYNSFADWISGNGNVVGASENGVIDPLTGWPEVRAVTWEDGQPNDLGTFGGNESVALAVNNRMQVVGMASNAIPDPFSGFGTQGRAFLWQRGAKQDLGLLGTGTLAIATNINEQGQVAGAAFTNTIINPNTGIPQQDSFFWEDNGNGMEDIPALGGGISVPNAINSRGQVVGQSDTPGDVPGTEHGYYWDRHNGVVDLGTLGGNFSDAEWINDAGEIVGAASSPNFQLLHAVLWAHLKISDLGALAGGWCSRALSINSGGQIVGYDCSGPQTDRAVVWQNGGAPVDLNTLIPPGSSLLLIMATSINDRGEIGGQGVDSSGNNHAFLLIPCDDKHRDNDGCHDGDQDRITLPQAAPDTLKRTVPPVGWPHRYHNVRPRQAASESSGATCSSSNKDAPANDFLNDALYPAPGGVGNCHVSSQTNKLDGECIGPGPHQGCSAKYNPKQCPPGKRPDAPTNLVCGFNVTRVDAGRTCDDGGCPEFCGQNHECGPTCRCEGNRCVPQASPDLPNDR